MSKHTPGPWELDRDSDYKTRLRGYDVPVIRFNGCIIASLPTLAITKGEAKAEDEANARLIAAAPELLAACMAVRNDCVERAEGREPADDEFWHAVVGRLTRTIAKAAGAA